ncbi:MAG: fluoride efflux transporter CrcB [Bacteroidota bacterium]
MKALLLVGTGGAAGSMARYGVGLLLGKVTTTPLPVATFVINILGSLIIGILFGLAARNQWLQQGGMLLLATGFCGGFTTFSSLALESVNLVQKGYNMMSVLYVAASVVAGLVLCRVGMWLAGS